MVTEFVDAEATVGNAIKVINVTPALIALKAAGSLRPSPTPPVGISPFSPAVRGLLQNGRLSRTLLLTRKSVNPRVRGHTGDNFEVREEAIPPRSTTFRLPC